MKTIVSENEIRRVITQILLEREDDVDDLRGEWQRKSAEEKSRILSGGSSASTASPEEAGKIARKEMIARGEIPAPAKLAIVPYGSPAIVYLGKFKSGGNQVPFAKVYSKSINFDPVSQGYGRKMTAQEILNGEFPNLDLNYMAAMRILYAMGNNSPFPSMTGEYKTYLEGNHEGKDLRDKSIIGLELDVDKSIKRTQSGAPDVYTSQFLPYVIGRVRGALEKGDPSLFYSTYKFFVPDLSKFYLPEKKSTSGALDASQTFGCAIGKKEFLELMNKSLVSRQQLTSTEKDRLVPCLAATSDSLIYITASLVVSSLVAAFATPLAGTATYAASQIVPTLPVLIYHVNKGNTTAAVYYSLKILADIVSVPLPFFSLSNLAAIVANIIFTIAHRFEMGTGGAFTTEAIKSAIKTLLNLTGDEAKWKEKYKDKTYADILDSIRFTDPQGLDAEFPPL